MNFLRIRQLSLSIVIATSISCLHWLTISGITSFGQVSTVFDSANKQTLVVFDIDETLTTPVDVLFQRWFLESPRGKRFSEEINDHIEAQEDPDAYVTLIHSKRMIKRTDQPIEPIIVDIIKNLQARGIKVIALTDGPVGSIGTIPSAPEWRWKKLSEIGIDFSSSFPQQEIELNTLTSNFGRHPLYYKGIVTTDRVSKGACLGAFLDSIGWTPKKVVYFDDKTDKIRSVRAELKKRRIASRGYLYRGTEKLPHRVDEAILAMQLHHLKEHDEFISDTEARAIIQKSLSQ